MKSFSNLYFQVSCCQLLLDNFEEKIHFRFLLDESFLSPTFFSANIISPLLEPWKPFQLNQHKLAPLVRVEVFLQVWSHLRSRNLNFHPTKAILKSLRIRVPTSESQNISSNFAVPWLEISIWRMQDLAITYSGEILAIELFMVPYSAFGHIL